VINIEYTTKVLLDDDFETKDVLAVLDSAANLLRDMGLYAQAEDEVTELNEEQLREVCEQRGYDFEALKSSYGRRSEKEASSMG
jgi:hypothetical protein